MAGPEHVVYTDGACAGNPGPGGWAALVTHGGKTAEYSGGEKRTTNQRMELQAALEALRRIPAGASVALYSDSAYLVNCFNQRWMERWRVNGWLNSKKEPVENQDLWLELSTLAGERSVRWVKVKGHGSNILNQRADKLARRAIGDSGDAGHNKGSRVINSGPGVDGVGSKCDGSLATGNCRDNKGDSTGSINDNLNNAGIGLNGISESCSGGSSGCSITGAGSRDKSKNSGSVNEAADISGSGSLSECCRRTAQNGNNNRNPVSSSKKETDQAAPPGKRRRIGVLTGGGDCPGLNAVIRAVVKSAAFEYGHEVVGFNSGFRGLVENDARVLDDLSVSGILNRGGTILGTSNRDNPFNYSPNSTDYRETGKDRSADALANLEQWGIECLVVIGGDGSLLLAHRFSGLGVPVIGIPKTIDNDLPATDVTFGFDSAVTTATEAIDKIHTTAESHHRVMVVEVMGRNAGWIALYAGMAGGGDIILIPELPFKYSCISDKIFERRSRGKKFSIVVVAEGAHPAGGEPLYQLKGEVKRLGGIGPLVSREIEERTGIESRATVLGHLQRGGSPTSFDRILATRFGVKAVELFEQGLQDRMVCLRGNRIESVPLAEAVSGTKLVDPDSEQVQAALAVGTSFGCSLR